MVEVIPRASGDVHERRIAIRRTLPRDRAARRGKPCRSVWL